MVKTLSLPPSEIARVESLFVVTTLPKNAFHFPVSEVEAAGHTNSLCF
jgi:hypothetical protein